MGVVAFTLILILALSVSIFALPLQTYASTSGVSLSGTVTHEGCRIIEGTIVTDAVDLQNTKIELCKHGNKYLKIVFYEACLEMISTWTDPDTGKTYGFPDSCGPPRLFAEGWKIYFLGNENEMFKIPYKINNGDVRKIEVDAYSNTIDVSVTSHSDGTLELTVPRNLLDSKLDNEDHSWLILIDGEEERDHKEVNTSSCFRTISINFLGGTEEILVMPDVVYIPEDIPRLATQVPPVSITTDKNNYEIGETIIISGCTSLTLDDKFVVGEVLGPEGRRYSSMTSELMIDGSFSIPVGLEHLDAVNGTYTATVKYAGQSATTAFVIPEFPVLVIIIFAIAISTALVTRIIPKQFMS